MTLWIKCKCKKCNKEFELEQQKFYAAYDVGLHRYCDKCLKLEAIYNAL